MEQIDFTKLSLDELKKLGCMRWGRSPIPNLWLLPGTLLDRAMRGQTLYGIDGNPYVVGYNAIDTVLLFGFIAYGVKVESDTAPGGPEISPEKLAKLANTAVSKGSLRRNERKIAGDRGMFFPN